MATSFGFSGNMKPGAGPEGSTGGGSIQPKLQLKQNADGSLGVSTDGSGGMLNYLGGLMKPAASSAAGAAGAIAPAVTDEAAAGGAGAAGAAGF